MIELLLQSPHIQKFRSELLGTAHEGCVILFTHKAIQPSGQLRLLEWDFVIPDANAYLRRGQLEAELSPDFVAQITKRAKQEKCSLVFVHSHPGATAPQFSAADDDGEQHLAKFLRHRIPNEIHAALVISEGGVAARVLGSREAIRVIEIGIRRQVLSEGVHGETSEPQNQYDRQIRAFGAAAQQRLSQLSVAIVGLGGTGSIVAQELAHLGVRRFILVDPDTVESTNLNRLANANASDVGRDKTRVARRYIESIAPDAKVLEIVGDVVKASIAKQLTGVDVIFGCTDSHGSRAVLQQISYQFLIPCIDMGSIIVAANGVITHIQGRVQMLAPGLPCLSCSRLLDSNEVRRDMMTAFERQADPYILGAREPAPAVMSLNATVASLAVTMLLNTVAEVSGDARHILYNALSSSMRAIRPLAEEKCFICSKEGMLAQGDDAPLMARQD